MSTESNADAWQHPVAECDVVMKGGITSGVIYPRALSEFAKTYRLRSLGGASAGAIGAVLGAAAEYGRSTGGFAKLDRVPAELGDGKLRSLFQPARATKPMFAVIEAATTRKVWRIVGSLVAAFPIAAAIGSLLGLAMIAVGIIGWSAVGVVLIVAGVLIALVGAAAGVAIGLAQQLTVAVPENMFGVCTGLSDSQDGTAFTEWLADRIDDLAGLPPEERPLTFGRLWGVDASAPARDRNIDLRMISTCVSRSRPYEMPFDASTFYFSVKEWRRLFPKEVIDHLIAVPAPTGDSKHARMTRWEDACALAHPQELRRLPAAHDLPVIVATRLSLSFPLLISAVPLWTIDHASPRTRQAMKHWRSAGTDAAPEFQRLWFTDGGLCSNFPVHLFDAPLPGRPTFAINLGKFHERATVSTEFDQQRNNVRFATTNGQGLQPPFRRIEERGIGAVTSFAGAAFTTAQTWTDSSHLDVPGYRDRILRVLQTKTEGGLNLAMDRATIDLLAERGRAGAEAMIDQFTQPHYRPGKTATPTGWDNHRWVRYRAMLAALPEFLDAYRRGREALLDIDAANPPSYSLTGAERALADEVFGHLDHAAAVVAGVEPPALDRVTAEPSRRGRIRRVPQM